MYELHKQGRARPLTIRSKWLRVRALKMMITVTERGLWDHSERQKILLDSFVNWSNFKCKLSCCELCFFSPGSHKNRHKTHRKSNKICEMGFLCRLVVFCPICLQCPPCCLKSACRSQTSPCLENIGHPSDQSQGHKNPQGRLHPPLLKSSQL